MFEVSETSMDFPSIHPSVEPACIRDMTLQNIESTKTNELVSLNKDSIGHTHKGSEDDRSNIQGYGLKCG